MPNSETMAGTSAAHSEAMIGLYDVHKSFGPLEVLKGISFEVPRGGVVALIGPSGSGKSTILRCVNLLETPNAGTIKVGAQPRDFSKRHRLPGDRRLADFRARTGMVFQSFNLFPHKSVIENVMAGPLIVKRMARDEARAIAERLLARVGLAEKAEAAPARLSGGQRQRVAIARAMAMEPDVMLFDEPTSALDPELVAEVLAVIRGLADDNMTMLLATHEMAFARDVADRVVFMRDGVVVEDGPARQVIETPQHPATQAFLAHFHRR